MENNEYTFDIMSFNCVELGSQKMAGTPDFVAYFDNKRKCSEHKMKFKIGNKSVIDAKLKKIGFSFNKPTSSWINPSKTTSTHFRQ